ncbi:MAG: hypothetical protein ACREFR_05895 [Limisphaerales bacterium]
MHDENVAICFALAEEAGPFKSAYGDKVHVFLTGIGRKNAEKAAQEFLAAHTPSLLITCGFAGGLAPELNIGDVVFETPPGQPRLQPDTLPSHQMGAGGQERPDIAGHGGSDQRSQIPALKMRISSGDSPTGSGNDERRDSGGNDIYIQIRSKLVAAGAKEVKIFCSDRIATTALDKKALREETGADAAEMESGAVHAVCAGRGIPCVTVRVISDTADEDLPLDFNKYMKEDKSLDMSKLMLAVAKAPWKMGALMELQKNTTLAAQRLANVLAKVIQ